jgi:hypothetical protein
VVSRKQPGSCQSRPAMIAWVDPEITAHPPPLPFAPCERLDARAVQRHCHLRAVGNLGAPMAPRVAWEHPWSQASIASSDPRLAPASPGMGGRGMRPGPRSLTSKGSLHAIAWRPVDPDQPEAGLGRLPWMRLRCRAARCWDDSGLVLASCGLPGPRRQYLINRTRSPRISASYRRTAVIEASI